MFERIMVPLDGSAFSERALPFAQLIAQRSGAELHLVQVHVPRTVMGHMGGVPSYIAPRWEDGLREHEDSHLRSLAARVSSESGIVVRETLLHGAVIDTLLEYARDAGIEAIIATTHGRGGVARALLGSVADGLVRHSHVPVMLVRPDAVQAARTAGGHAAPDVARINRLLIALDGSDLSARVLEPAATLARVTGAACTLLRVVPPFYMLDEYDRPTFRIDEAGIERARDDATSYLRKMAHDLRTRGVAADVLAVSHEDAAEAIITHAAALRADVIALSTHGRGGWQRVVLGSVADRLVRAGTTPVLLFSAVAGRTAAEPAATS